MYPEVKVFCEVSISDCHFNKKPKYLADVNRKKMQSFQAYGDLKSPDLKKKIHIRQQTKLF